MIKFENLVKPSAAQWEAVIRGVRACVGNQEPSDSYATHIEDPNNLETAPYAFFIGENDLKMLKEYKNSYYIWSGMIHIYVDVTAPLYFWREIGDRWEVRCLSKAGDNKRTLMIDYTSLSYLYEMLKNDGYCEIDIWREFCEWIEDLPYSELITEPHKMTI